jgi:two-component system KDP operon response regulator KdpE
VVTRVLVVDDEPQLVRALRIYLIARGYEVETAGSGTAALDVAAHKHPDLVILDLGLPDLDGQDVITALRGWTAIPILVLSGRTDSSEKVEALDAGADDYLTKPFAMDELLARLRALNRRAAQPDGPLEIAFGDVVVDLHDRRVTRTPTEGAEAETVRLTPTEWALLEVLLRNPGRLVSQRKLLADVWGPEYHDETNYLRYYLARLRRKLEPVPGRPRYLLTEPGMGYRFQP